MKKSFILAAIILLCAPAFAQNKMFDAPIRGFAYTDRSKKHRLLQLR